MSDLFGNHIVGFPTRWLTYCFTTFLFPVKVLSVGNTIYICGVGTRTFIHTEVDGLPFAQFLTDSSVGAAGFNMTYRKLRGNFKLHFTGADV